MNRIELRPRLRARRGTAAVELALALPVLLTLVLGVVDVTRAIQSRSALDQAAAAGARRAMDSSVADSLIRATVTATAAPVIPTVTITRGGDSVVVKVASTISSFMPGAKYLWGGPITINSSAVALVVPP
jgi:Flp pilus assembly protein TadG